MKSYSPQAPAGARPAGLTAAVLLVVFLTLGSDILLRFIPLDWVTFRAWEAYKLNRAPIASLVPNVTYRNDLVYGDLASLGNLPHERQYRQEVFTTDQHGFRNLPRDWGATPPEAMLIGSSFSVGPGMSDHETLASQLSERSGRAVYNAAGYFDEISLERIRHVARLTGMQGGTVILEYVERFDLPPPGRYAPGCGIGHAAPCSPIHAATSRIFALTQISPFQILVERMLKTIHNDVLFPNRYAGRVLRTELRNGDTMLFLPEEAARSAQSQGDMLGAVARGAQYVSGLETALADDGLQLIVVLVPNKYTVYHPLTRNPQEAQSPGYLDLLEEQLRASGTRVVNLLPVLKAHAAADLQRHEYIYWRDDTHWNPRGIQIAAQSVLRDWEPNGHHPGD